MSAGRTTEPRTVTATTTSGSTTITAPAGTLDAADAGRPVTATGVPAGATLTAVPSDTAQALGYVCWSPETPEEAAAYTVDATGVALDRVTNTQTQWGEAPKTEPAPRAALGSRMRPSMNPFSVRRPVGHG